MVWTYLAIAVALLVLLNVIVVAVLLIASRPRDSGNEHE